MSGRDFFGKKLGGWVYKSFAHLSPIDLHAGDVGKAVAKGFDEGGWAGGIGQIFGAVKGAVKNRGSYSIGDWFAGRNIGEAEGAITDSIRHARVAMRVAPLAAMGVAAASGVLAPDNPLDRMARAGLALGTHATIAGALGRGVGWGASAAYSAAAGLNMLRPGDNLGPF
jgi:hypothetical protein